MPNVAERQSPAEPYADDDVRWSALMASAQCGHEADYRQLLGEISAVLSGYLAQRIGGQEFVEDCVQEVLIAVHQARHTYDPARKFRPWLFAIARHKAIDMMRAGKRRGLEESLESGAHDAVDVREDAESQLIGGQLVSALAEPFREAITLTKLHGLSSAEAAARLAISESALKVRVHRGIGRLRKMLEAEA